MSESNEKKLTKEEVLAQSLKAEKEYNRKFLSDMRRFQEGMNRKFKSVCNKNDKTAAKVLSIINDYYKQISEVMYTIQCVDESLCNVLLAIRQNEYLQAWHPEQHDCPELKVVGRHPAKIMRKPE